MGTSTETDNVIVNTMTENRQFLTEKRQFMDMMTETLNVIQAVWLKTESSAIVGSMI